MTNMMRFIIVYALFTATALAVTFHKNSIIPTHRPFSEFPLQVQSWQMSSQTAFSAAILGVLKPTDYLYRQYKDTAGNIVSLYIGFHDGGKDSGSIHSPKHCLPGSGWHESMTHRGKLDVGTSTINLTRAVYQKGDSKELFLYWYQIQDRTYSDDYSLKFAGIVNSAFHSRRDASFIRISVPFLTDIDQANAIGEKFIRDFVSLFREYLPQ